MNPKHLTHGEAVALCRAHQYLRGAPMNDQYRIDLVTVAPYGIARHLQQVQHLLRKGAEIAGCAGMEPSDFFDVVLVAFCMPPKQAIIMKSLQEYLTELAPLYGVIHNTTGIDALDTSPALPHLN